MRNFLLLVSVVAIFSCQKPQSQTDPSVALQTGIWRGALQLNDSVELPFLFNLTETAGKWDAVIHNGEERLNVEEVAQKNDSLWIQMAVFNTKFFLSIQSPTELTGVWRDESRGKDYAIPFSAKHGEKERFILKKDGETTRVDSIYAIQLFPVEAGAEAEPAIGRFDQSAQRLAGTFLTETGDYRYLVGGVAEKKMMLSAFDGSHAFVFAADIADDGSLKGEFWSGSHWYQKWGGQPDPNASLRKPEDLTFLKDGYEQLAFSFPDLDGLAVSLEDEFYQDKVVIVQLMGSWCPNCMDESKLFSQWYSSYQKEGLEIVALAFERGFTDEQAASQNLKRLKKHFGIDYEILLASLSNSKQEAAEALPMLNHVMSFPTSIFIDREGRIRKIHTGFNGPGTGDTYTRSVEEYSAFLEKLLRENDGPVAMK
ncbi:MAG: TlpA disulfide reductase family protein [Bacteroidota bacterium]